MTSPSRADQHADNARMTAEVREGLFQSQKELPSKYFYDRRGSELFEEITRLPEYYLTRAERSLLERWMPSIVAEMGTRTLVELGAGSAEKTRILLDAMRAAGTGEIYVPIDVSVAFVAEAAARLRRQYPSLRVVPAVADISESLPLPRALAHPTLFAFLGSTIGNFDRQAAVRLLRRVRSAMQHGDRFLMGADLKKDPARIEAAYNDSRGVTADFNRNMLRVLNREMGATFDPESFEHRAFYEPDLNRVEMHLVSRMDQQVAIPRVGAVDFRAGESIRTEISCKYDRESVEELFEAAGLKLEAWKTDREGLFALALASRGGASATVLPRKEQSSRGERDAFVDIIRRLAFTPASTSRRMIGAEVELIPIDAETMRVLPIEARPGDPRSMLRFLRTVGDSRGWSERRSTKGVPAFDLPDGSLLAFEPGGQIEYSSAPAASASALLANLRAVILPLREELRGLGVELLSLGIHPDTRVEQAPLQLHADRYSRMADHFARLGPDGARMMRQTAAFQVSLDFEDDVSTRWRTLNAMSPYIVAIFANSPVYGGVDTGMQSFRANVWRGVDPSRTGILSGEGDAVENYLDFALDAPAIMMGSSGERRLPFAEWVASGSASEKDWNVHLSTLFPEVRPRGYVEIRSADTIPPEWYAAPLALLAGATYHRPSLHQTVEIVGVADSALLRTAGIRGLHDPILARGAAELVEVALAGCTALGEGFIAGADLDVAREFFEAYTLKRRSPADDARQS
ncbi:MAG: L-histidine N(alpha)-methyltransferase [Gemmatimonadaceae bacterium]